MDQYEVKSGPIFGGLIGTPSKKQEKEGNRTGGIWLDIKVTATGVARRIWFGKTEVKKV